MKLNKLILALFLSGTTLPAFAQESLTIPMGKEVAEVTEEVAGKPSDADVSKAAEHIDTADLVDKKITNYVRDTKNKLLKKGKHQSTFIYSGTAEISTNRDDPRWSEYRASALDKAVLEAQKDYLQTLNTSVENNMLYSFTSQTGLPTPTKEDFKSTTKMTSFLDKVVAVLDGKLDAELKEMGIDPEQFKIADPSIKRDLFKESVVKEVTRTSYGDLAGMTVIRVFEEVRSSGKGSVGVVMALSADKRNKIRALVDSKGEVSPEKAKANTKFSSVYEQLVQQNDNLYLKIGTQMLYDNEGYPFLISYGQAGVTHAKSSQRRKLERKTAQLFATNNAWAAFAQTYNLGGDFRSATSEENQQSETEQFDLIAGTVRAKSSGITENIIKKVEESANMTSSVQGMTGVNVEYEWRRKHPITNHEMVGSVLVWHPKTIQSAVNMVNGKNEQDSNIDMNLNSAGGNVNSAESEDMFDVDDF